MRTFLERVVVNSQTSEWIPVKAGALQGFISDPVFLLIYINDLLNDIASTTKLFADDTLFSLVHDAKTFKKSMNEHISGNFHLIRTLILI